MPKSPDHVRGGGQKQKKSLGYYRRTAEKTPCPTSANTAADYPKAGQAGVRGRSGAYACPGSTGGGREGKKLSANVSEAAEAGDGIGLPA